MSIWAGYAAYLFDLDGTLVDTAPDINAALNYCLRQAKLPEVDETLTRHWVGHGSRVLVDQALAHHNRTTDDVEPLLADFLGYYADNLAVHSQIYPDVENTLKLLRDRGAKLAVVTNKLTKLSVPLLEQIGLRDLFDLVVCGDTAAAAKPDPAPVYHCLNAFGQMSADRALFVGDSDTDVNAANAAGVDVICVRDGYNHGVDVTTLLLNGVIDGFGEILS